MGWKVTGIGTGCYEVPLLGEAAHCAILSETQSSRVTFRQPSVPMATPLQLHMVPTVFSASPARDELEGLTSCLAIVILQEPGDDGKHLNVVVSFQIRDAV